MSCAFEDQDGQLCDQRATARVHHKEPGRASAYACPRHIGWAMAWVREQTGERAIVDALAS